MAKQDGQSVSTMGLSALFGMLTSTIKNFVRGLDQTIEAHEREASSARIKEVMDYIKEKAPVNEKERTENTEILKLLNQLNTDKRIFTLMKVETHEWLELLELIEKRLEQGKDEITAEEKKVYGEIKNAVKNIRTVLREN